MLIRKAKEKFITSVLLMFVVTNLSALSKQSKAPAVIVEVCNVQTSVSIDHLTTTGNLIAIPGIVVKAETAGRITNIYFNSGGKVKAGTSLIEIYPVIIKAQLIQAHAELKLAELNFLRMEKLRKTHTISEAEYDKAKSAFESSKGKFDQCQASLDQTVVRAPFDGYLGVTLVSLGQHVTVGQDIVSLQSLAPIYVDFTVPEIYASKVAIGQSVNIRSNVYPKEVFGGTVCVIDPLINKNTRSLSVRAAIANREEKLLPGAFADVTLFTGSQKQIIKIPQTAVVHGQNENYVYKVVNGKAIKTIVITGQHDSQNVVITNGLNVGDVIVTKGQMNIHKDGESVVYF